MQLDRSDKSAEVIGYGTVDFDVKAIEEGVIVKPELIAEAMHYLFENKLVGGITSRRAAMALPSYRTFTRSIQFPKLDPAELHEAVQLEVEQYVPMQLEDLYLDYVTTGSTGDMQSLFVVAVPKKIVDSYLYVATRLGLEPVMIEPTVTAVARFFESDQHNNMATIIIDFGSLTATISVIDKTVLATSTVGAGGLVFTEAIRNELGISQQEAGDIKTKFGLDVSKYQKRVAGALEPSLNSVVTECRRMLRYHEEHYTGQNSVGQIVTLGGGANMPGLSEYLTDALKVPVRTHEHPWAVFHYDHDLALPMEADRLMYATVAGLSLLNPKGVFAS